jgi:hypothetical protein
VTAEEGRRLFAALRGEKRLFEQPEATHNGLDLSPSLGLWDEVVGLLERAPGPSVKR